MESFELCYDAESYAGGAYYPGRATIARQVNGHRSDKEQLTGPTGLDVKCWVSNPTLKKLLP